jgi:plastocyanin
MKRYITCLILTMLLGSHAALAADESFNITIKNHTFIPNELTIPTGKKVKLMVKNEDATPEEFESYELNREKIINGNSSAVIFVGPLEAGTYQFFGEFNPKTAQGKLIAK